MKEALEEDLAEVVRQQEEIDGPLSESQVDQMVKNGIAYANEMWNSKGEGKNKIGEGFVSLLQRFKEEMGPSSWDHNPDLIRFTEHWSDIFADMNLIEQVSATHAFLRGFAQVDESGDLQWTNNRNVLPPVSDKADFTVLNSDIMSKYFEIYNKELADPGRTAEPRNVINEPLSRMFKKACR